MLAVVARYRQCPPLHTPDYTLPASRHRVAVHQGISYAPISQYEATSLRSCGWDESLGGAAPPRSAAAAESAACRLSLLLHSRRGQTPVGGVPTRPARAGLR